MFSKNIFLPILLIVAAALPGKGWPAAFSIEEHWRFPISPQGKPPSSYSELEASLKPESCGTCHSEQYEGWKGSRHSLAMGPGISGQLHSPWLDEEEEISCLNCHAPLAEQSRWISSNNGSPKKNAAFIPSLSSKGIACAACHLRGHTRFGPKRRGESPDDPPHDGFVEAEGFSDSRFCRPCHQFNEGNNRVAGKLLQNTYAEWESSGYPEKGVHCQTCHMPDRAHLWRGIHDPEMVKKGVDISAEKAGRRIDVVIKNSGVGHKFPSYVTPKVILRGVLLNNDGEEISETVDEAYIGWGVSLDLSEEHYDTRIKPGGTFEGSFDWNRTKRGREVRITIRVLPDDFYTRFYKVLLNDPPEGVNMGMIRAAYEDSLKSTYTLFDKNWDI